MHQQAEHCHYELTGTERQPILQAEALREKDREIARLRQALQVMGEYSPKIEQLGDSDQPQPGKRRLDAISESFQDLSTPQPRYLKNNGAPFDASSGPQCSTVMTDTVRCIATCLDEC